jgi:hypothetical protein
MADVPMRIRAMPMTRARSNERALRLTTAEAFANDEVVMGIVEGIKLIPPFSTKLLQACRLNDWHESYDECDV